MKSSTFIVSLFIVIGVIAGVYVYTHSAEKQLFGATSTTGSTYNSSNVQSVVLNLANTGTNGTSTSITNNSGYDRYVTGWRLGCTGIGTSQAAYSGAGLASLGWLVSVGTTSVANTASTSANAYQFGPVAFNYAIPTSTTAFLIASSTMQTATSGYATIWRSGENMTFIFNATNTASCSAAIDFIGS